MTEKELNSYRFGTNEEPSDEMLEQIIREVAQEARESNQRASDAHFKQMFRNATEKELRWANRIKNVINS